jgi:hypothetical protein
MHKVQTAASHQHSQGRHRHKVVPMVAIGTLGS